MAVVGGLRSRAWERGVDMATCSRAVLRHRDATCAYVCTERKAHAFEALKQYQALLSALRPLANASFRSCLNSRYITSQYHQPITHPPSPLITTSITFPHPSRPPPTAPPPTPPPTPIPHPPHASPHNPSHKRPKSQSPTPCPPALLPPLPAQRWREARAGVRRREGRRSWDSGVFGSLRADATRFGFLFQKMWMMVRMRM